MWDKDHLVGRNVRVDRQEGHLEQSQCQTCSSHVGLPDVLEIRHEISKKYTHELMRNRFVRDEHLQHRKDLRVGEGLFEEEVHVIRPDFGEHMRLEQEKYLRQELDDLLGLARISVSFEDRKTT